MATTTRSIRLFTVRLWREEAEEGRAEWRGKVQALPEGEAYYFRDWPGLIAHLQAILNSGHDVASNSEEEEA